MGGEANLPSWLSRSTILGTSIEVDPCAAILVILVTVLLCAGVKEVLPLILKGVVGASY